ncbi:unnamed protein product [Adineta steineri]|uniref:Uncharacterized protein n=1 Tax=Adineta steineri TaxID=433720 RepID=A0A819I0U0_9BILA|nr:unnamed protein product [Adineta steineri]CAF3908705.1 unnamed protein product [Adineta steineri]
MHFTFTIALYIPNYNLQHSIINTMKIQNDTWLNESITIEPTEISTEFSESNISTVVIDPTTWLPTDSTVKPATNLWSNLKQHLPALIGIGSGICLCVILSVCTCCYCRRRRIKNKKKHGVSYRTHSDSESVSEDGIELSTISPKKKIKPPTSSTKKVRICPKMALAKEFVESLDWDSVLFDSSHDKCYCNNCYPATWANVTDAGGQKYVIPRGWVRIGLYVDAAIVGVNDIWNKWIVTFHGTSLLAAKSILHNRQFCLPGDKLIDGTLLGIRPGHIPNKKHIYTSPTIAYSSLPVYSAKYDFNSSKNYCAYKVQLVLQCRQKPNTYSVQGETIDARTTRLCPFIPNSEVEYFTEIRGSLVAYGLLVKVI